MGRHNLLEVVVRSLTLLGLGLSDHKTIMLFGRAITSLCSLALLGVHGAFGLSIRNNATTGNYLDSAGVSQNYQELFTYAMDILDSNFGLPFL